MANLRVGLALLAGLSLIPAAAAVAQQQSQSSSQQKDKDKEKPKPKAKKVWSEDDVKQLRTDADDYELNKRAEADKAAAEKEKAAKQGADAAAQKTADGAAAPPKKEGEMSLDELNKQIDARYAEIREHQQMLAELLREMYDSSSDQVRSETDAKVAHARETLREVQLEHQKLVEMRDEMMAKQKAAAEGKPAEEAKPPVKPPVQ